MDSSNGSMFSKLGEKMRSTEKPDPNKRNKKEKKKKENTLFGPRYDEIEPRPQQELSFKITFIGDYNCGAKTSFLIRYVRGMFDDRTEGTIGASLYVNRVNSRGKDVKLEMWDTPCIVRYYRTMLPMYYAKADGVVIGYDITNRYSVEVARNMLEDVTRLSQPGTIIILIGAKADLGESGNPTREMAEDLVREFNIPLFFEVSARTGVNVNESMSAFVDMIAESKGY